jgi:2-dehydro-3-deoxyphosphogluconate aldolase/(4S)-4-hydroxy-2-oxoglutarate aldolase
MQNGIKAVLSKHQLVPVVTINSIDEVDVIAQKLQDQGISCIEITLRTEIAWEAVKVFKERFGSTFDVGVGTIVSKENVAQAVETEVDFMVSPGCTDELAREMTKSGIPFLPGVSTPSEIIQAKEHGFTYLKFFPANLFGGLKALKTFGALFPECFFCPTGGISEDNYPEYLSLSNVVCVGGSWLTK